MTVLILGGTGVIGSRIARRFITAGEKTVCFDSNPNIRRLEDVQGRFEVVRGDITEIEDIIGAIIDHGADMVINMAYVFGSDPDPAPQESVRVNVMGMNNAFEAARLTGVGRVLFASSIALGPQSAYGERAVTEDDRAYPNSLYGWLKQFNEAVAAEYAERYGMVMTAVRPPYTLTPDPRRLTFTSTSSMIPLPALGEAVTLAESPETRIHIGHVDDVAEVFYRAGTMQTVRYRAYQAGGHTVTFGELAGIVREFIPDADISFDPQPTSRYNIAPVLFDNSRIKEELGFEHPPLAERVQDIINEVREAAK